MKRNILLLNKKSGFTLVELTVVILITALLAVFAIPRYMKMQQKAKESIIRGVEAALHSAVALAKAEAKLEGKVIGVAGQSITLTKGLGGTTAVTLAYNLTPTANAAGIVQAVDLWQTQNKVRINYDAGAGWWPPYRNVTYYYDYGAGVNETCRVTYREQTPFTDPNTSNTSIDIDVTNCNR